MRDATVLLVEDDTTVLALTRHVLRVKGYNVLAAKSVREAVTLARECAPIHLLLTDVVLPKLSGPLFAETFRPLHPNAKILFMSGYTDEVLVRHQVPNCVDVLRKPFTVESLVEKIDGVLAGKGSLHILLVDDDHALRVMAAMVLSSNGFRVTQAATATEAQKLSSDVDLLLTDLELPDMKGTKLAKELGVRTLFMTGWTNEPIEGEVIRKPFSVQDLLRKVRAQVNLTDTKDVL